MASFLAWLFAFLAWLFAFLGLAARIKRLADTVVNRSSLNSTGTSVWLQSCRVKAVTFSACLPRLPSIERGKPTITCLTCCWRIISVIAATSAVSPWQLIIVSGLAKIPSGSLSATPIRFSPRSSPKLRVIIYLRAVLSPSPTEGLRLFYPGPYHRPDPTGRCRRRYRRLPRPPV